MVILTNPYGQRSNNFFQHIHLDSFCKENGIKFFNPFLRGIYSDYPNLKNEKQIERVNSLILFLERIRILRIFKKVNFYSDEKSHKTTILTRKLLFCNGWLFRSFETTIKYRNYYQKLFDPDIDKPCFQKTYLSKTNADEKIIAVHIRRGDYKYFTNGIYFYNDNTYITKIHQLITCLNSGNYKILLFSDDKSVNIDEFKKNFKNVILTKGTETIDHFLMSKCDYIIGPPSTFSLWASYIGEAQYYHIKNTDDIISLDKFSVCNG